jgi:hypothetical protein
MAHPDAGHLLQQLGLQVRHAADTAGAIEQRPRPRLGMGHEARQVAHRQGGRRDQQRRVLRQQ